MRDCECLSMSFTKRNNMATVPKKRTVAWVKSTSASQQTGEPFCKTIHGSVGRNYLRQSIDVFKLRHEGLVGLEPAQDSGNKGDHRVTSVNPIYVD